MRDWAVVLRPRHPSTAAHLVVAQRPPELGQVSHPLPAAVTSVTTLPGRRPETPTSAIVSSAIHFGCKLEEFEKVSEGGLEYSSRGFFPRVVKSPAACSSAAKTGEMSPSSVSERELDPALR